MQEQGHKLADDAVVIVKGRVDKRDDAPKLIAQSIDVLEVGDSDAEPLRVRVRPSSCPRRRSPTSSRSSPTTPAGRPCSSTSASGRSFACPNSGTSTRPTACSGSSRWCSERGRSWPDLNARACSATRVARAVPFDWTGGSLSVAERGLCRRCRSL